MNKGYLRCNGKKALPAEQEEVMSTKFTTVGQKDKADSSFKGISPTDLAKFDGATMRAVRHEHSGQPFL